MNIWKIEIENQEWAISKQEIYVLTEYPEVETAAMVTKKNFPTGFIVKVEYISSGYMENKS